MENSNINSLLSCSATRLLIEKNNLLAFSYGLDSTALYHLLKESGIPFDIALVNYGVRPESKKEEEAARKLARVDGRRIYIAHAPKFTSSFEAKARRFRYDFFGSIIDKEGYDNLLTAHQLNDRLEWMMMRLIRGAGIVELTGMEMVSKRTTPTDKDYHIVRPLLQTPRHKLEEYLKERKIKWFEDITNRLELFERNRLRPILEPLIHQYAPGIARSFDYISRATHYLKEGYEPIFKLKLLQILKITHPLLISLAAADTLKEMGYLPSYKEREALDSHHSLVIGRRWAVVYQNNLLFIAPYQAKTAMTKSFKERCRLCRIPPKIRPYLYSEGINPETLPIN